MKPRTIRSQVISGVLIVLIPIGFFAWMLRDFDTPDFALTMPADEEFRPVKAGEVFQLLSPMEIRVEDPEGLEVSDQWRPVGGGDAFHKRVRVVWIRRRDMGVRFSSKGCGNGEALINGVLRYGPVFQLQRSGAVVRVEGEPTPLMIKLIVDPEGVQESR